VYAILYCLRPECFEPKLWKGMVKFSRIEFYPLVDMTSFFFFFFFFFFLFFFPFTFTKYQSICINYYTNYLAD
ncbi:MAG: hypothetical protein N7Q72_05570, partial [Spiroplasma sp. Tabriz.8]|nr:hypothetical protein [Spiroplasma sp. Tabriz.8]